MRHCVPVLVALLGVAACASQPSGPSAQVIPAVAELEVAAVGSPKKRANPADLESLGEWDNLTLRDEIQKAYARLPAEPAKADLARLERLQGEAWDRASDYAETVIDARKQAERLGAVHTRRLEPGQRGDQPSAQGGGVWFGRSTILTSYAVAEPLVDGGHVRARVRGADMSLRRVADTGNDSSVAVMKLDPYVDLFPAQPDPVPELCSKEPPQGDTVWIGGLKEAVEGRWEGNSVSSSTPMAPGAPVFADGGCLVALASQEGTRSHLVGLSTLREAVARFGLPRRSN